MTVLAPFFANAIIVVVFPEPKNPLNTANFPIFSPFKDHHDGSC